MNLSFMFHGGTLALTGLALMAIPIVVHLLLKQKPKTIVFPAMQLLRQKQTSTLRRLRIQNWLLLALRMLLLALVGLALERPTIHSEMFSLDQKAPVAVALIFDTSMSMQYKDKGQTRLQDATGLAKRVVEKLPEASEITVLESGLPVANIPLVPAYVPARLETLDVQAISRPLNQAIAVALKALAKTAHDRREVYIFTDLTTPAWTFDEAAKAEIDQLLALMAGPVTFFVIDVGIRDPNNAAQGEPVMASQTLTAGSALELQTTLQNMGTTQDRTVTFTVDGVARDSKAVQLPAGQRIELNFSVPDLGEGLHQGEIALNNADPLPFDDTRYFTVKVRQPIPALVIADDASDTVNWVNALDPAVLRRGNRSPYRLQVVAPAELANVDFANYQTISLLNVTSLSADVWNRLAAFVQAGGGLFVALGERVDANAVNSYNSPQAQAILPAKLVRIVDPKNDVTLAPDNLSHPLLAKFALWQRNDMSEYPILRYWKVERTGTTTTVIPYSNSDFGLLERTFGEGKRGRALLLTTAAHYRPTTTIWSEWPAQAWSFVALAHEVQRYLSGREETTLNYLAGAPVNLPMDPANPFMLFTITNPKGEAENMALDPTKTMLSLAPPRFLGNYRVEASEPGRRLTLGFAVNAAVAESDLRPLETKALEQLFPKDRFKLARNPDDLEEAVVQGRVGREMFPYMMLLALLVIAGEGYLANAFYRKPAAGAQPG